MTSQEYDWQPGGWQVVTKKSRILKTQEHYAWKRELNCFQGQCLPASRCLSLRLRFCLRYCAHPLPYLASLPVSPCLSHAVRLSLSVCPSRCVLFRCAARLSFSAVSLSRCASSTLPASLCYSQDSTCQRQPLVRTCFNCITQQAARGSNSRRWYPVYPESLGD